MEQVKKIIEGFYEGKISLQECANDLCAHIYKYRLWYGLGKLSMDSLHDFMTVYIPRLKKIILSYKKEAGTFEGYLYASVSMGVKLWKRKVASSIIKQNCLNFISRMDIEEAEYGYQMDENPYVCEASPSDAPSTEQLREIKKKFRPVSYNDFRHKVYSGMDYTFFSDKKAQIIKKTCLVLFAKCAYYADDALTEKISVITDTPLEQLQEIREKIMKELNSKLKRIRKYQSIRDSSFYYRNKYMMELNNIQENAYLTESVEKKIEERSKIWKEKNMLLKEDSNAIIPSNAAVARVLGMNARNVKYILDYAQKNIDNLTLKRYNKYYEDIFGKRQREQKAGNE